MWNKKICVNGLHIPIGIFADMGVTHARRPSQFHAIITEIGTYSKM